MSESPAVELCTYILLLQLPRLGKRLVGEISNERYVREKGLTPVIQKNEFSFKLCFLVSFLISLVFAPSSTNSWNLTFIAQWRTTRGK